MAADIKKPGMTTGKATFAAQELYESSAQYGQNQETMLDTYQPGQDPKRFAAGFQNAYILGTLGEHSALGDSKAAAYLIQQQRELAYDLGVMASEQGNTSAYSENGKQSLAADSRDNLQNIPIRAVSPIAQGFTAFPQGDVLHERAMRVKPDGDKFDVAMHGSPQAVALGTTEVNTSPRLLAQIILHNENYHGQDIRLLSCNTGCSVDGEYCFAEELANALGVTVWAPNDLLFIDKSGMIFVGRFGNGSIIPHTPNERGRRK